MASKNPTEELKGLMRDLERVNTQIGFLSGLRTENNSTLVGDMLHTQIIEQRLMKNKIEATIFGDLMPRIVKELRRE